MRTSSAILGDLAAMGPLRRGQLTEQAYTVRGKDGKPHRQGPYYVLTWSDGGKKMTRRIPADDVARVREELSRGKEAQELVREYFRAKEAEADEPSKKKDSEERWEYGREVKDAIDEVRARVRKTGKVELAFAEDALRTAALRAIARFLGAFYTEELPSMLGVERPDGRHGTRAVTVLSTVGEVRY